MFSCLKTMKCTYWKEKCWYAKQEMIFCHPLQLNLAKGPWISDVVSICNWNENKPTNVKFSSFLIVSENIEKIFMVFWVVMAKSFFCGYRAFFTARSHSTFHSAMSVVCSWTTPRPPPPPPNMISVQLGQFQATFIFRFFYFIFFFTQFFFTSKICFSLSLFYAFLDVSYHPEWVKQGATQCHQAF